MTQNLLANSWIMVLVVLWVLPWKGVALWKAAQKNDKWWFIALLILNTLGILEIIYIYIFSKRQIKSKTETVKVEEAKAEKAETEKAEAEIEVKVEK